MERKTHIGAGGAAALVAFSLVLGFNQVVVKVSNDGMQPVFAAGVRSFIALTALLIYMRLRGIRWRVPPTGIGPALLIGALFSIEFIGLYKALDLTSVARVSIIFYSMPVWLALVAHFTLPGERLTPVRAAGLVLAMAGVAVAMADRQGGQAGLAGDLFALGGALGWAGVALTVRLTSISEQTAEEQLAWQLAVSGPMLLVASLFFGPLIREMQAIHYFGLAYQSLVVAFAGFLIWFAFLRIYPASSVASFSFLTPVFAVLLGWLLLGEDVALSAWAALGLVAVGLILINRRGSKGSQQK